MPLYDYTCAKKHTTETRQAITVDVVACPVCGLDANRAPFYTSQFIQCETGPRAGKKNPTPPSERKLGQEVSEYHEAQEEVDYHYAKAGLKAPDLFAQAKKQAKKRNPKIR